MSLRARNYRDRNTGIYWERVEEKIREVWNCRRGDNEQGEEVREVSSCPEPGGGGPVGGSEEEEEESEMWTRSKEPVLWAGSGRGGGMWMSVCVGVRGRLTSGLHYKRQAQWGSADLSSEHKGAAPERNKKHKASGDTQVQNPKTEAETL